MNLIKHLLTLHGMIQKEGKDSDFVRFFKTYIDTYEKKDKRVIWVASFNYRLDKNGCYFLLEMLLEAMVYGYVFR